VIEHRFIESVNDSHTRRREEVLNQSTWYSEPPSVPSVEARAAEAASVTADIRTALAKLGLVKVLFDRPLSAPEFASFATGFGTPMPETSPSVQPFVEGQVVLNLITERPATDDIDLQPFAESPLTLHTESSMRPVEQQPHYLLLQCISAPATGAGGQTVVISNEDVASQLKEQTLEVLAGCTYANSVDGTPFLRYEEGRPVFSFRDFGSSPFDVRYAGDREGVSGEEVREAIHSLLRAMYSAPRVAGIHWRPNVLVVVDNFRTFHGRTRGHLLAGRRHLQRIRVLSRI
jgi:alpha-ketoglutarate-dependent taurine dioxygenase